MDDSTSCSRPSVLVIDDEPSRRILNEALADGYRVFSAGSGEEGQARAAELKPDLVIAPLLAPGIDGCDLCRRLKGTPSTADIEFLLITTAPESGEIAQALQSGADDFLIPPATASVICAKVEALLRRQATQRMRIARLVDLMPHGISIRDDKGTLLLVNQRFADFYGQEKSALLGRNIRELIQDGMQADRLLDWDRRVLRQESGLSVFEERLFDAEGQPHPMLITKTPYSEGSNQAVLTVAIDIGAQKQTERALKEQQHQLSQAERLAAIGSWEWDFSSDRLTLSDNFYRLMGLTRAQLPEPDLETWHNHFCLPEEAPQIRARLEAALEAVSDYEFAHRMVRSDGAVVEIQARGEVVQDATGRPALMRGTIQDITQRKRLEERQQLMALVFEQMEEVLIVTDTAGTIMEVNEAFTRVTGFSREEAVGRTPALLRSQHHDASFYRALREALGEHGHWEGEIWNRRKGGELYPSWLIIQALTDSQGRPSHYIGISRDLSAAKAAEERLYYLTNYDVQTGLPNRARLTKELQGLIDRSTQSDGQMAVMAVMAVHINDFRLINETFGLRQGDAYIAEIGNMLRGLAPRKEGVGRIDTHSLAVLLPLPEGGEEALSFVQQVLAFNRKVVTLPAGEAPVSLNVGLSLFPGDAQHAEALLEQAVIALSQSLQQGRGSFEYYAPVMNSLVHDRLQIQADLYKALRNNEFFLQYQPKMDLTGTRVVGAEALIRWQHPQRGFIPPSDFIPVAEASGLINDIGAWVLREACRQARLWRQAGVLEGAMAVNLSALQLRDASLLTLVQQTLRHAQLPAEGLELEITESVMMDNPERSIEVLQALRQLGIGLSLDDFGTGHSSLHYLSRLPVDKVKIDRSFVQRFEQNVEDALIIKSILGMARGLGLKIVAEGVETASQWAYLRKRRCDELQGYYFSKPLDAAEFEDFVANRSTLGDLDFHDHEQRSLLVIDDEPNLLLSLKRLLRREGYQLLLANSVQEAQALLAQHPVQVVVCDQRMPDMDGTEFFQQLKRSRPDIVRIMLSGYNNVSTVTDAINRGQIYKYIPKPWEDAELVETLQMAFDKYDMEH